MHINMEDVIVELHEGDVIVTNLASYSFPIIRYRLGDQAVLSDEVCACGRQHPLIAEVIGRKGASVVGVTRRYPALTFYYVFKNIALRHAVLLNYKATQDEPGRAVIEIQDAGNGRHEPLVRAELDKYFGRDIEFTVRFVAAFERTRKKMQYFESRLPQ
jgi:phenylacetate-CoA ligase